MSQRPPDSSVSSAWKKLGKMRRHLRYWQLAFAQDRPLLHDRLRLLPHALRHVFYPDQPTGKVSFDSAYHLKLLPGPLALCSTLDLYTSVYCSAAAHTRLCAAHELSLHKASA